MAQPTTPAAVLAVTVLLAMYFGPAVIQWLVWAVGLGSRIGDTAAANERRDGGDAAGDALTRNDQ